jgi:hypothetical protein
VTPCRLAETREPFGKLAISICTVNAGTMQLDYRVSHPGTQYSVLPKYLWIVKSTTVIVGYDAVYSRR